MSSAVHRLNASIRRCVVTGDVTVETAAMRRTAVSRCSVTVSMSSVAKLQQIPLLKMHVVYARKC